MNNESQSSIYPKRVEWLSIIGACLSIPLLIDMAIGLATPMDMLFTVITTCWLASIILGIISVIKARRAGGAAKIVLLLAATPFIVFALGFLPIWPIVNLH